MTGRILFYTYGCMCKIALDIFTVARTGDPIVKGRLGGRVILCNVLRDRGGIYLCGYIRGTGSKTVVVYGAFGYHIIRVPIGIVIGYRTKFQGAITKGASII